MNVIVITIVIMVFSSNRNRLPWSCNRPNPELNMALCKCHILLWLSSFSLIKPCINRCCHISATCYRYVILHGHRGLQDQTWYHGIRLKTFWSPVNPLYNTEIMDKLRQCPSIGRFKSIPKTYLFNAANFPMLYVLETRHLRKKD